MFEPAKNFMFLAAKKYHLEDQAIGSLMCEKAKVLIQENYPDFTGEWQPQKYKTGTLTIRVLSAAGSSALYMQSNHFLEAFNARDLPEKVETIKINKVSRSTTKNTYN